MQVIATTIMIILNPILVIIVINIIIFIITEIRAAFFVLFRRFRFN